ncbi:helix-turn-helix domain-containing protein [Sphaerisporangium sp. NPDC088356]|uniref:winged helix-turn-helix domain-containing protein n=1 Tax=Sphaerisporangium sp. NPDC088356 TaxID=3154871 RepID=UPI00343E05E4
MSESTDTYRVSDPQALKAVSHPLRVRLLGALRLDGPATATELAARFGESSGSTSYHLRQLARYGFVEEDPERRDARERRWRSVHGYTSWSELELGESPEGREAADFMRNRQIEVLVHDRERFESERESWGPAWVDAAGMADDMARLTPASVKLLYERFSALIHEMEASDAGSPDAQRVSVHLAAFPSRGYGR